MPTRRLGRVAVTVFAVVLVAVALMFGIWATVTGSSAVFGRLTSLAGVFSLVLAVVITSVAMIGWARRPAGAQQPAPDTARIPGPQSDGPGRGAARGPVVAGNIPQEPPGFQPRRDLLAELDRPGPRVSVVHAVTGMRGVGKTQLAAAYARAKLAAGWRLVAWVNAEDTASLQADLAAVAEAGGLADQWASNAGQVVRRWLEADGDRCLIVFDNATDPAVLRPYIPAAGAARVLITSNRQSVADLGASVGVEVFSPAEAVAFLADRTGPADTARAEALAQELGFLPLALAQAAAVIAGQHLSYGTYLDRLRALPVGEYLTRSPGDPYPYGVAEAVLLSLEAVQEADQEGVCAGVLEMMSVLSAAGIRRDLIYAAGQAGLLGSGQHAAEMGAAVVDGALGQLVERSLLTFSLDGQAVLAHRLVLRVVRDQLAKRVRLAAVCQAAASVLAARARELTGSPERPAVRDIPEQVAALQDVAAGLAGKPDEQLARLLVRLRQWALYYLNELGDSAAQAIAVGEPLTAELERVLGPDHPDTLRSQNELARAYGAAGQTADAIRLLERTLGVSERVLGPDHPDTMTWRGNLANAYGEAGRAAEAMTLNEQTLAALERVLGPDHPDTLASRVNLAVAYGEAGRTADAIRLLEQTLGALKRVLGPDHPDTLTSQGNLAVAYGEAGRTADAIRLHEQTLGALKRVLGPDHPDTLTSQGNLANAYGEAGRTADAIRLHERTLAGLERVLGPDHPDTLTSRGNLFIARSNRPGLFRRVRPRLLLTSGVSQVLASCSEVSGHGLAVVRDGEGDPGCGGVVQQFAWRAREGAGRRGGGRLGDAAGGQERGGGMDRRPRPGAAAAAAPGRAGCRGPNGRRSWPRWPGSSR